MLIAPGSPAYNAGNPAFAGPPTTDQRGQARVYQRIDIEAPIAGDIDAICEAYGIEGKRARDKLHRAARLPGGLRVVRKIIQSATTLAGPDAPISAAHIDTAFDDREAS